MSSELAALARFTNSAVAAGFDAGVTLWFRWPILLAQDAAALTEWNRAWSEKVAAVTAGSAMAAIAMQKAGADAVLGRRGSSLRDVVAVAEAFNRPGFKAVAANAKRLRARSV